MTTTPMTDAEILALDRESVGFYWGPTGDTSLGPNRPAETLAVLAGQLLRYERDIREERGAPDCNNTVAERMEREAAQLRALIPRWQRLVEQRGA